MARSSLRMDPRPLRPCLAAICADRMTHALAIVPDHLRRAIRRDFHPGPIVPARIRYLRPGRLTPRPTSRLTPILMLTPSFTLLSYVIDTNYSVPSAPTARSTSELPSAPWSVMPTLTRRNVLSPSVLFHRFGVFQGTGWPIQHSIARHEERTARMLDDHRLPRQPVVEQMVNRGAHCQRTSGLCRLYRADGHGRRNDGRERANRRCRQSIRHVLRSDSPADPRLRPTCKSGWSDRHRNTRARPCCLHRDRAARDRFLSTTGSCPQCRRPVGPACRWRGHPS